MSLQVRVRQYKEVRHRLFGENQLAGIGVITRRVKKARERFRSRKQDRRKVQQTATAIGSQDNGNKDPRPYVVVEVAGCAVRGLLDSGASLSVLGYGCRELVHKFNISWRPFHAAGVIQPLQYQDALCITLSWCLSVSPMPPSAFVG